MAVERAVIDAVNSVDEGLTVATLPPFRPVTAGEMVATVKVIPYAVPGALLREACAAAGSAAGLVVAEGEAARLLSAGPLGAPLALPAEATVLLLSTESRRANPLPAGM